MFNQPGKKVGVSKEEKALPYYKYFEGPMAPVPVEKFRLVDAPSKVRSVPFEEKNAFLREKTRRIASWVMALRPMEPGLSAMIRICRASR